MSMGNDGRNLECKRRITCNGRFFFIEWQNILCRTFDKVYLIPFFLDLIRVLGFFWLGKDDARV
jgi:hypothetical protein